MRFWGRLLCLFLPLWFFLGALCLELARHHYDKTVAAAEASGVLQVTQGHQLVAAYTANVFSDLLLTAYSPAVHAWAEDPTDDTEAKRLLEALAREKPTYDQIRLLDMDGNERIRVNSKGHDVQLVDEHELQNKAQRYYFQEAKFLELGEVFVSRIDLNVEHGKIVEPHEPTIRFATQVVNLEGKAAGILLINFRVDSLLNQMGQLSENFPGEIHLLDHDGYWLKSENPQQEWGFMFPAGESKRLGTHFPELWAHICGSAMGSVNLPEGHAHWQRVQVEDYRGHRHEGVRKPLELIVLGLIDVDTLAAIRVETCEPYRLFFGVSTAILLAGCVGLTFFHDRQQSGSGYWLDQALREAPWSAMLVTESLQVLWVSDLLCRDLGYGTEDLTGRSADQLILMDSPAAFWATVRQAILADGSWHGELRLKSSSDAPLLVRAVVSSVRGPKSGSVPAYVIVFPDLSVTVATSEPSEGSRV